MEGPIETAPDVSERNENDIPVASTSVVPATPEVTEAETMENRN